MIKNRVERERCTVVCTLWQFDEMNNFEKRFLLFKNSFIIYFIINEDDHHASLVMSIRILGQLYFILVQSIIWHMSRTVLEMQFV